MLIAADYPFLDILWTMVLFFAWVVWIWTVIVVLSDLFGRHDIHGWGKAGWTFLIILLPFLGVLIYLGLHGREMAERRAAAAQASKSQFDDYVRDVAAKGGPAGEIAHAKELLAAGTITQEEFDQLKRKALA